MKLSKEIAYDYFILAARLLLARTLLFYELGKLTGSQFGVTDEVMNMPLKSVDLFRLSWFLADHEPFNSFIGISQMIAGLLLLLDFAVVLGGLMSIPIFVNILIWDMTFMGPTTPFTYRLSFYLILCCLILWYSRSVLGPLVQIKFTFKPPTIHYPLWAYAGLPICAMLLEGIAILPSAIVWGVRHLIGSQ